MNETKTSEDAMKISARNLLKGKVKMIKHGRDVYTVIKASNVMIATD